MQVRFEQTEPALVGPRRCNETRARKVGGSDARQRTPSRMQPLGPSALLEEDLYARGSAGGNALGCDQLGLGQAEQLPRCKRGAEMGHDAGRMKTGVMEPSLCGGTDPDGGLDADRIGRKDLGPRCLDLLTNGKRGRQPHDTGMHYAHRMSVVVIQTVHEQAIGEGCIAGSEAALVADHGALARSGRSPRSGRCSDSGDRRRREILRVGSEGEPKGVERVQTRLVAHLERQRLPGHVAAKGGELRGRRAGVARLHSYPVCGHRTSFDQPIRIL
jgi:hypothetical protein